MQESKKSSKRSPNWKDNFQLWIFDLDRTLLRRNSSFCFYFFLLKRRQISLKSVFAAAFCFLQYQWGRFSLAELHQAIFSRILHGLSLSLLSQEVEHFLDRSLHPLLNSRVWKEFQRAKKRGEETFLLSSSPAFLVKEIAKRLHFDRWQGTEYAVDKEGRLCHISHLIEGETKLQWAKKGMIPAQAVIAYSDSAEDLPLLEWAGKAVAVNPDRILKARAKQRGWEIL